MHETGKKKEKDRAIGRGSEREEREQRESRGGGIEVRVGLLGEPAREG